MDNQLEWYKTKAITFLILLSYTLMHTKLTSTYTTVPFDKYIYLDVPLPYAQRVLIPLISSFLLKFIPVTVEELLFILEFISCGLLFMTITWLLQLEFNPRQIVILRWLFFLILPLTTVINYRFTSHGESACFYAYDTPSLFFASLSLYWIIKKKWLYFLPMLVLATLNRESTIIFTLLIPLLHYKEWKTVCLPFFLSVGIYFMTRYALFSIFHFHGPVMDLFFKHSHFTLFEENLYWLSSEGNWLFLLYMFAFLPIFWFVFSNYIPAFYQPIKFVALLYSVELAFVGIYMEARIFAEIVVLLFLPVTVGIRNWLQGKTPERRVEWYYFLSYWFFPLLIGAIVWFRLWIIEGIHRLSLFL